MVCEDLRGRRMLAELLQSRSDFKIEYILKLTLCHLCHVGNLGTSPSPNSSEVWSWKL
jgi:hypothetical protein